MSEINDHLHRYAVAYLKIYGEAALKEIVDSFIRMFPDETKGYSIQALRSKLCKRISSEIKWLDERADIQRTGRCTYRLKDGFQWEDA